MGRSRIKKTALKAARSALSRDEIADRLERAASLLEAQGADRFRVRAYRNGAEAVRKLVERPEDFLSRGGLKELIALPGIGEGIARAIDEMTTTGRWRQLERLQGETDPVDLFQTLPGVGPSTARLLHEALHVDTLEALELAVHEGRLADVPGVGPRRTALLRVALDAALSRRRRLERLDQDEPPVASLLAIDARYREQAKTGRLPRIAPKRFNPEGEAWLPILHHEQDAWSYTALYSNTERAHRLGRTQDWVVLFFHRPGDPELQRTVVTETRGPLAGRRVVRGRETECERHYVEAETAS